MEKENERGNQLTLVHLENVKMHVYVCLLLFCSDCKWWNSRRRLCKSDRGHSWSFWTCRVGPSSQQSLATAFVSTAVHCYASVIDSTSPVCDWICYASRTLDVSHWKVVMLSVCPKSHPQSVNLSMTVKRVILRCCLCGRTVFSLWCISLACCECRIASHVPFAAVRHLPQLTCHWCWIRLTYVDVSC